MKLRRTSPTRGAGSGCMAHLVRCSSMILRFWRLRTPRHHDEGCDNSNDWVNDYADHDSEKNLLLRKGVWRDSYYQQIAYDCSERADQGRNKEKEWNLMNILRGEDAANNIKNKRDHGCMVFSC